MTQTKLKASDHLDAAADYIEEHGLHKGWYFKGFDPMTEDLEAHERAALLVEEGKTPKCCTLGALAITAARAGLDAFEDLDARRYLAHVGVGWWSISDWNDAPSQRKGRVVKTLRKAADLARKDDK